MTTRGCAHRKLDVILPEDHPLIRAVHGGPLNVSADLLAESGRREREYREAPRRPVLRYHGGKWMMARWIISRFPAHRIYTELYGGAASVLMQKQRTYAEVYNDLDGEIVNVFRVIQRDRRALMRALGRTPFAREEYRLSFERCDDPLEQARRTIMRSFMGFGSNSINREIKSGFRANARRSNTTAAQDWANYPACLRAMEHRLRGVVIENKPATAIIRQQDSPETLHYVDPPYVHATRATVAMHGSHGYAHEMSDADHEELAQVLHAARGMVVLSGYHSDLYDRLYGDWHREERRALADGAGERLEVLWFNPLAQERLKRRDCPLFTGSDAR